MAGDIGDLLPLLRSFLRWAEGGLVEKCMKEVLAEDWTKLLRLLRHMLDEGDRPLCLSSKEAHKRMSLAEVMPSLSDKDLRELVELLDAAGVLCDEVERNVAL